MSMGRSRFGRHTQEEATSSSYTPDLIDKLIKKLNEVKLNCHNKIELNTLNPKLVEFYFATLRLLDNDNLQQQQQQQHQSSPLSFSSRHSSASNLNVLTPVVTHLPKCLVILFAALFDIQLSEWDRNEAYVNRVLADYKELLSLTDEFVLGKANAFLDIFKIGIFVKALRVLFEVRFNKEDLCDRRITDLMRSEFTVLRFDSEWSSPPQQQQLPSVNANKNSFSLSLLFFDLNQLLFKHMTAEELNEFVFNQCF